MKKQVCSVGNLKGGVGKTTLSLLLARYLSLKGHDVLLVDADPQGSATQHLLSDDLVDDDGVITKGIHILLDVMLRSGGSLDDSLIESQLHHVVPKDSPNEAYWLLPNFLTASYYDSYLTANGFHLTLIRKVLRALDSYSFDVVIIDCPPYVNAFTTSALVVSRHLIVPVESSPISVVSARLMLETAARYMRDGLIPPDALEQVIIVPTKVRRTTASSLAYKQIVHYYGDYITSAYLPFSDIANKFYAGAYSVGKILQDTSRAAVKITALLEELENKIFTEGSGE